MPFKILALARFRPHPEKPWPRGPVPVDTTNLDRAMQQMDLSLSVPLPTALYRQGELTFHLEKLRDFHPDRLVTNTPFLNNLVEVRRFVAQARTRGLSATEIRRGLEAWPDLPPLDFRSADQRPETRPSRSIDRILETVALPDEVPTPSAKTRPMSDQIDAIVQQILDHVFSHEDFQNLESSWRGLRLLMRQGGVDGEVKVEIAPVSHDTLEDTLAKLLPEMAQNPPCLVIVDLPFDNSPRSLELLEKIAQFSENLLAPAVSWITPGFFFLPAWQDLKKRPFLPRYLEESAFAKWRRLREKSFSRWLAVACNRFLLRYPYGPDNKTSIVQFEEATGLWASPVWALGCLIGQSVMRTGWPTRFTEYQRMRVEDLALRTVDDNRALPTEAYFSEERIHQFIKVGITPLVASFNKDMAFTPAETTAAGGSLGYQLFVTRITQLLLRCKDSLTEDLEPAEAEKALKKKFSLYWEKTGHPGPESLEVSVTPPDPDRPTRVRVVIKPPREILSSGEKVELVLRW